MESRKTIRFTLLRLASLGVLWSFLLALPEGARAQLLENLEAFGTRLDVGLPDPVIARRTLSDKQCELLYPGNAEALAYNQGLRSEHKEQMVDPQ